MANPLVKAIPGTQGLYGATKAGHIFTKKTPGPGPDADDWARQVSCPVNSSGYKHFGAYLKDERKWFTVHEAVLLAWVGPMPADCDVIMHLNNKKTDNRLENLKYASKSENEVHKHEDGLSDEPLSLRWWMDQFDLDENAACVAREELFLRYSDSEET